MSMLLSVLAQSRRRGFDAGRFVVRVDTNLRSGSTTVLIPVNARTGGDRTIDWGDGNVTVENAANPSHTYATNGVYTIQMYGGTTTDLGNALDAGWQQTLTEVVQWGKAIGWTSFFNAFRGCIQNILVPSDFPRVADGYAADVTTTMRMFQDTSAFNQDIGAWNTPNVSNMRSMFQGASAFNQYIGAWDTPNVFNMSTMFQGAVAFDQDIGSWPLRTVGLDLNGMLNNSGMSTENYSRTLIGWANSVAANSDTPASVTLGATGRTYNDTAYVSGQTYNDAVAARAYLTGSPPSWSISDGGQV